MVTQVGVCPQAKKEGALGEECAQVWGMSSEVDFVAFPAPERSVSGNSQSHAT